MMQMPDDRPLSRLGLGSYHVAGVYGGVDEENFVRLVQVARDEGVTLFDTAPSYGEGEVWLGRALSCRREHVLISSKFLLPPETTPVNVKAAVITACEDSLRRLKTDYIDLYHLHYDDESMPHEPVIESLTLLRAAGKIRRCGLSHVCSQRLETYLASGLFSTVMMEWHPLASSPFFRVAKQAPAVSLIGYSVTGRGLFTGRFNGPVSLTPGDIRNHDPLFRRENLSAGRRIVARLGELGRELERPPTQLLVAWALAHDQIACVLTSTTNEAHLRENLAGTRYQWPKDALTEFCAFVRQVREDTRLSRKQTVERLLNGTVPTDVTSARRDIIYVLESMHNDDAIPLHVLMPLFGQCQKASKLGDLELIFRQLQELAGPPA